MTRLSSLFAALFLIAVPVITAAQADTQPYSIVLVHGAFVDASGWRQTYETLSKDGYEVIVVQNPTISLAGDAEVTRRAIGAAKHPVILVGHSYGGVVIPRPGRIRR